jgi:hypothetical protein
MPCRLAGSPLPLQNWCLVSRSLSALPRAHSASLLVQLSGQIHRQRHETVVVVDDDDDDDDGDVNMAW